MDERANITSTKFHKTVICSEAALSAPNPQPHPKPNSDTNLAPTLTLALTLAPTL